MKKFLILSICAVLYSYTNAQNDILQEFEEMKKNFTGDEKEWVFTKVVDANGKSKDQIYMVAIELLAGIYVDSKEVIQSKDKDAGQIIAKGFVNSEIRTVNWATIARNRCWHLIKIDIKDGRYKITLSVNSVWAEQNSKLGAIFAGQEYALKDFYPYWEKCKKKFQSASFENLKFAYSSSISMMDKMEEGIAKKLNENNDW